MHHTTPVDLTILSLTTLGAMKQDAIYMLRQPGRTRDTVINARDLCADIDNELDRRVRWADEVRTILAATV